MNNVVIGQIKYAAGEQSRRYDETPSFSRVVETQGLSETDGGTFGWGNYYKTEKDIIDLGLECARQTLNAGNSGVDFVLFCSTNFGSFATEGGESAYNRILSELGLTGAFVIGLTLNNCTNLLSAIDIGSALLSRENCNRILVISSDKVIDEEIRFTDSCVFSDAAVSFLMSKSEESGLAVRASGFGSDHDLIANKSVFADVQLYRSVHDNMVARYPFSTSEITKVFANNLFLPVLRVKETSIGLSSRQLYLDNVVRHGHCFSADPLINMHDYCANNSVKGGEKFLLTSNASGLRAALLVEYFQGE